MSTEKKQGFSLKELGNDAEVSLEESSDSDSDSHYSGKKKGLKKSKR